MSIASDDDQDEEDYRLLRRTDPTARITMSAAHEHRANVNRCSLQIA